MQVLGTPHAPDGRCNCQLIVHCCFHYWYRTYRCDYHCSAEVVLDSCRLNTATVTHAQRLSWKKQTLACLQTFLQSRALPLTCTASEEQKCVCEHHFSNAVSRRSELPWKHKFHGEKALNQKSSVIVTKVRMCSHKHFSLIDSDTEVLMQREERRRKTYEMMPFFFSAPSAKLVTTNCPARNLSIMWASFDCFLLACLSASLFLTKKPLWSTCNCTWVCNWIFAGGKPVLLSNSIIDQASTCKHRQLLVALAQRTSIQGGGSVAKQGAPRVIES